MKKFEMSLAVVILAALAGCMSTNQPRSVKPTGFLGDCAELVTSPL